MVKVCESSCRELQRATEGPSGSESQRSRVYEAWKLVLTGKFAFAQKNYDRIFLTLNALSPSPWPQLELGWPRDSGPLSHLPSLHPGAMITRDPKERSSTKGKV